MLTEKVEESRVCGKEDAGEKRWEIGEVALSFHHVLLPLNVSISFPPTVHGFLFCSFLGFRSFLDSPRSFILLRPEEIDFDPLSKPLQTPPWVFLPFFRLPLLFSRFRSDRSNEKKRTKGVEVVTVYHQKEKSLIIIGWALVFSPVSPPQFFLSFHIILFLFLPFFLSSLSPGFIIHPPSLVS